MKTKNKPSKLINKIKDNHKLLILLLTIAVLLSYLAIRPFETKIINTNPSNSSHNVSTYSNITLTFNRELETEQQQNINIDIQPPTLGTFKFETPTKAIFEPEKPLNPRYSYVITITGKDLLTHTFSFQTGQTTDFEKIIEQNKAQYQNSKDPVSEFIRSLPYWGEDFHIQYTALGDNVLITLYANNYDELRENALEYIQTYNIKNPEEQLNIMYRVPRTLDPDMLPDFSN